jgi:NADH-quinone oxidoreductase subunit A
MLENYLPLLVLFAVAGGMGLAFFVLAKLVGPSRPTPTKSIAYECGLDPASSPKIRFSVQFYRIALLFLVFDIEAAFFYPWAVLYRDMAKGGSPFGMLVMLVFMAILLLALVFVWKRKALEWE